MIKFQVMAPKRVQISIPLVRVKMCVSTRPDAIVLATAVPHSAPIRLVTAASKTACLGVRTLVETTVAIELAVS